MPWLSGNTQFHFWLPIPLTSDLTPFLTSLLTADSLPDPFIIQLQHLHPLQLWHYPLFTLPLLLHSYSPLSLPPSMDNLWLIWLVHNSDVYLIDVRGHPISPCIPDSSNLHSNISFNTLSIRKKSNLLWLSLVSLAVFGSIWLDLKIWKNAEKS